ncbi:DUF4194 domain-containing protein [uncultured Clostridium sp.]|uniref:DUF4194 domain-containing protein n=1 Tax=uncultured Clostridium sp. TaxID=59620 RepID=UPI00260A6543|nr:DUF4194 domain-containing protein [uncultured Clostridium sp.]
MKEQAEFKRVCNKILGCCLITKYKENCKKDYHFIERNLVAMNEYLEVLGFEIEVNRGLKIAQLINTFGSNRYKFNLIESISILILKILYYEKHQELATTDHTIIEVEEFQNKFIALGFKLMDKTTLRQVITKLKRYNILEPLDREVVLGDSRLIIYPTIQALVKSENIKFAFDKIQTYKKREDVDFEEVNRG